MLQFPQYFFSNSKMNIEVSIINPLLAIHRSQSLKIRKFQKIIIKTGLFLIDNANVFALKIFVFPIGSTS